MVWGGLESLLTTVNEKSIVTALLGLWTRSVLWKLMLEILSLNPQSHENQTRLSVYAHVYLSISSRFLIPARLLTHRQASSLAMQMGFC